MKKKFSSEALIRDLKVHPMLQNSYIALGYVPALPLLCILNDNLCMKIPYVRYKVTGEVDRTEVYPTRYLVTVTVPEKIIIGFDDLAYNASFSEVLFGVCCGYFRHEAVKHLSKDAYKELRRKLYAEYDKIVFHLCGESGYDTQDEERFTSLLNTLLEPSLYPYYELIDKDFSNKYLTNGK